MNQPKNPAAALPWIYSALIWSSRIFMGAGARLWTFMLSYPRFLSFLGFSAVVKSNVSEFFTWLESEGEGTKGFLIGVGFALLGVSLLAMLLRVRD